MDMVTPSTEQDAPAAEALLAYQQSVLRELTELGLRLTRVLCDEVEAQARSEQPQRRTADPALMFSRLSRAIRLNLALETRLAEGDVFAQRPRTDRPVAAPAVDPKAAAVEQYRAQRQARIDRRETVMVAVEMLIDFEAPEDDIDRMLEDLERLADPEDDARFADAPLSQWIAAICKDLGLPPNWAWLADADWAAEEAVTWPDSPFAKLMRPDPPPGQRPDGTVTNGAPPSSSPTGGGGSAPPGSAEGGPEDRLRADTAPEPPSG